jgi:hypothetical protein
MDKTIRNSKFRCLSEATPYYHNVFTFTLLLPEGRAGIAWEPSNKIMLFLPPRKIKCLSLHPLVSSMNLLFISPSHLSLGLGCYYILSSAGLLASSQYASGRSSDRPFRHRFSWVSSVFKQMLRWFPSSKLLLHASHAALPK